MVSFQKDIILTLENIYNKYDTTFKDFLINHDSLLNELTIDEASKLITYVKNFEEQTEILHNIIQKIKNIKNETSIENKIENELLMKITPIMTIYRQLLYQKYNYNKRNINNFPISSNTIYERNRVNRENLGEINNSSSSIFNFNDFSNVNLND